MSNSFAITGAHVVPVSAPAFDGGAVIVEDGRITAVGPDVTPPDGMTVIDAAGSWLVPGFVESHGGGTILLARGDLALEMGLPVLGVVGWAQSFGDGVHTSIPAPGLGALGVGRGGRDSAMALSLAALGVAADDIAVISKHDTSTNANDPNEAELHTRLARALGRSKGATRCSWCRRSR